MEEIKNIKQFTNCINCLKKVSPIGRILTNEKETEISVFDGVTFVKCKIPELKEKYDNNIDLTTLQKLCKVLNETDKLKLIIENDLIKAKVTKPKSEINYEFPNVIDHQQKETDKAIEKADKIEPPNEIQTSPEWIAEQIDALIFKTNDKQVEKVFFNLTEKTFLINDDNRTAGKSTVSLLNFHEYKIKFKNKCKVKINYYLIKDLITQLKQFSDKLLIRIDDEYPVKIISYDNKYKITIIVAPMIEND